MNQKATTDAVGQTEVVLLSEDDAVFGLELHRTTNGWTATTTGPHLPIEPLQGVSFVAGKPTS